MAELLLQTEPLNIYSRRVAAWVYVDMIKTQCTQIAEINYYLTKLRELNLDTSETILWEQTRWQVAKVLFKLEPGTAAEQWKRFGECIAQFPKATSQANSTLLKALLKHQTELPLLAQWMENIGWDTLQVADYQSEMMPNGKSILSIAERLFIAVTKNWLVILEQTSNNFEYSTILSFLKRLDETSENKPQMLYLVYYRTILRLKLNLFDDAQAIFVSFARRKQSEFWVWDLMAQLYPSKPDIQLACLAKALTCKATDEFLVKVRQRMAAMLIANHNYEEARTEIALIKKTRQQNGWRIPDQIQEWEQKTEISIAQVYTDNTKFYESLKGQAETLLKESVPTALGFIYQINTDKKTAQFFVDEKIYGGFNFAKMKIDVLPGQLVRLGLAHNKTADIAYWEVTFIEKCTEQMPIEFQKSFKGMLKTAGNIGFVEDVLIEPQLLQNLPYGIVEGIAIRAFNVKKQSWGWKAVELSLCKS